MSSRPSRLFKYQPVNAKTLENLTTRKLWFSAVSAFNDPFDCRVDWALKDLDDDDIKRAWEYVRSQDDWTPGFEETLASYGDADQALAILLKKGADQKLTDPRTLAGIEQTGVACFSAKNDDLLMWGHYADGHRGFCMEFDASRNPFSKAQPVVYRHAMPPPVNLLDILDKKSTGPDLNEVVFRTKCKCWQYEEEWRILSSKASAERAYSNEALTGVYLGLMMPSGQKDVIGQLLAGSGVQVYEMSRGNDGFSVVAAAVE